MRREMIRKEFDKKGFEIFNSGVECWKLADNLNRFSISPLDEAGVSSDQ